MKDMLRTAALWTLVVGCGVAFLTLVFLSLRSCA